MGWGGRWEGGSEWGTHVHPWLIHVNVWQNSLQYCKVIHLQLNKLKKKYLSIHLEKFKRLFVYITMIPAEVGCLKDSSSTRSRA